MMSFIRMKSGAWACVIVAAMSIISAAEAAIIVKPRTGPVEVDAEERAGRRPQPAAPKPAELAVNVSLPFDKLAALINQFDFRFQAKDDEGALTYDGTLALGKVRLGASGETQFPLRAIAPFRLTGKLIGVSVTINGEATIDFALDVGSDWCPIVKFGEASIAFTERALLPRKVTNALTHPREFIAGKFLTKELQAHATCELIKKEIARAWGPITLPMTLGAKKLFLRLDPQSLALSRFAVGTDAVSFSLSVGALTAVSDKAPAAKKAALPAVKSIQHRPVAAASTEAEATLSLPITLELPDRKPGR